MRNKTGISELRTESTLNGIQPDLERPDDAMTEFVVQLPTKVMCTVANAGRASREAEE